MGADPQACRLFASLWLSVSDASVPVAQDASKVSAALSADRKTRAENRVRDIAASATNRPSTIRPALALNLTDNRSASVH
ncbi:MAG: hypothetical protein AAF739_07655 [Pseudomonadota bacterium]